MVFSIDGTNILPYIAHGGLKWQRADVDGQNAGRDITGDLIRDRKAIKYRWDVTCKPLTAQEMSTILSLIEPEWVSVTYTDPVTNAETTQQMYANNFGMNYLMLTRKGVDYYTGLTFPLVMK